MLLYYITDRTQFSGDEAARRRRLLDKIAEAARCGIDYIQLREKNLAIRDLETLACEVISKLPTGNGEARSKLLINSRSDVAIAAGADGVHLRSNDITAETVRSIWKRAASAGSREFVAISCHSDTEIEEAGTADFAVFAPVFEKQGARPAGMAALREACQHRIPVLALGGVTLDNARACLDAGAAGIAAIRLFQENDLSILIPKLRSLAPSRTT